MQTIVGYSRAWLLLLSLGDTIIGSIRNF